MDRERSLRKLEENRKRLWAEMIDTEVEDTPEEQQRVKEILANYFQAKRAENRMREEINSRNLGTFGPSNDDLTVFEDFLKQETGKRRSFDVYDVYDRRQKASLSYYNKASDLHAGALVLWDAAKFPIAFGKPDSNAQQLGLGDDFSLNVALPPVFALLAGLSIELVLKAVSRLLEREFNYNHKISELSDNVGISLSSEHAEVAASLTEYVYWASRYPTPKEENRFWKTQQIFQKAGNVNLMRYESLWKLSSDASIIPSFRLCKQAAERACL